MRVEDGGSPTYVSGRFSTADLSDGYTHSLSARKSPGPPESLEPARPSSPYTPASAWRSSPGFASAAAKSLSVPHTQLTTPEPASDDSDDYELVKAAPPQNPFARKDQLGDSGILAYVDSTDESDEGDFDDMDLDERQSVPQNELRAIKDEDGMEFTTLEEKLKEYDEMLVTIPGHEKWTETQATLHKLLSLRGYYPMFRSSWQYHFLMRNVLPTVYVPEGQTDRPVPIDSVSNDFLVAKALGLLFDLSSVVRDFRLLGLDEQIAPAIKKHLKRYIDMMLVDAGLHERAYLPTVRIYDVDTWYWEVAAISDDDDSRLGADPLSSTPSRDLEDPEAAPAHKPKDEERDPISDEVEQRMTAWAEQHRRACAAAQDAAPEADRAPPLLFAFVIFQHRVMVVTLDAADPTATVNVFAQVDLSLTDQWLWNALSIAIPVQLARDSLVEIKNEFPLKRKKVDDPDL